MNFAANIILVLILMLLFLIVGIALQVFLSRRPSRWPGLVLPGVSFLCSIFIILCMIIPVPSGAFTSVQPLSVFVTILNSLFLLLFLNIPTMILLAIYFAARKSLRKKSEIDKMHIDDL